MHAKLKSCELMSKASGGGRKLAPAEVKRWAGLIKLHISQNAIMI